MNDDAVFAEKREGDDVATIPFYQHEALMFQNERKVKRLTWALIAAVILLIVSNAAWYFLR